MPCAATVPALACAARVARARRFARGASVALVCLAIPPAVAGATPAARIESPSRASPVETAAVELPVADGRSVPVRLFYPVRGGALPVVVFSHGAYASAYDYDAVLGAWARAGYVVFAPTHPDSTRLGGRRGAPTPARVTDQRVADLRAVIDAAGEIVRSHRPLAGRVDPRRIAVAGHSYGAWIAQTLGGATRYDPALRRTRDDGADPRVDAVILFSGPGRLPPVLRDADFGALRVPSLVTVGTADLAMGPVGTLPGHGYAWRRQPHDLAPPGGRWLLVLEGADHYLGGTVGRDDRPRDPRADAYVDAFVMTSLAFLDAELKGSLRARRWLRHVERVGEVGRLERR